MQNIFKHEIHPTLNSEVFTTLFQKSNIKIERIVSNTIKQSKSYKQKHDEWILLLEGKAVLSYNPSHKKIELNKGDTLFIPANQEHSVYSTDENTIWLAIHIY